MMSAPDGSTPSARSLAGRVVESWRDQRLDGAFLARNVDSGDWLGFGLDESIPLASVIKVPIALVALDLIESGDLDPWARQEFQPPTSGAGPTGLALFTCPAAFAGADLLSLMLTISDNVAADRLLDLIGLARMQAKLEEWGLGEIRVRHRLAELFGPAIGTTRDDLSLAHELAVNGSLADGGHRLAGFDQRQANVGTARSLGELLERVWTDTVSTPPATARLRQLMGQQPPSHRLSAELRSDTVRVSAKTGSYLTLRHEIGVVTSEADDVVIMVALSRSGLAVSVQPGADATIAAAARDAFDLLRG